jgi:hypothetical protein
VGRGGYSLGLFALRCTTRRSCQHSENGCSGTTTQRIGSQCSPCQPARCISPLGFIAQSGYFMRPDGNLFELLTARREAQREFQLSVQQKLREYYSSNLLRTLHRKILNKLHHPGLHMRINGLAGRISQQVTPQSGRSDCTLIPVISYPLVGCTPYWNDSGRRL